MKVSITDAGGQLGKELSTLLGDSIGLSYYAPDLKNISSIENSLDKYNFDTIN